MQLKYPVVCALVTLALAGCAGMGGGGSLVPQQATITVRVDQPGAKVSPAMWGAFFEDINFGGDGGLYAEMVKNRGFEFPDALMGWIKISPSLAKGDVTIQTESPYRPSQTHYVRIASKAEAPLGISNEGFRGMGVAKGEKYNFSAQLRNVEGNAKIVVQLVGADGTLLASAPLTAASSWSEATATLTGLRTCGRRCRNSMPTGIRRRLSTSIATPTRSGFWPTRRGLTPTTATGRRFSSGNTRPRARPSAAPRTATTWSARWPRLRT